jgi:hypothetical protein
VFGGVKNKGENEMRTTWNKELKQAFENSGDDFSKMIINITDEELNLEFDCDYGGTEGVAFTAWGEKYVYFPIQYDGSEWVGSAPRNPCDEKTGHQGGG